MAWATTLTSEFPSLMQPPTDLLLSQSMSQSLLLTLHPTLATQFSKQEHPPLSFRSSTLRMNSSFHPWKDFTLKMFSPCSTTTQQVWELSLSLPCKTGDSVSSTLPASSIPTTPTSSYQPPSSTSFPNSTATPSAPSAWSKVATLTCASKCPLKALLTECP